jgi:outer membrane protein assembly factor BamB
MIHPPRPRPGLVVVPLLGLGLAACRGAPPDPERSAEAEQASPESAELEAGVDLRPSVGRPALGEDVTEASRAQNRPGKEPAGPVRRGNVWRSAKRPTLRKTEHGFVANIGGKDTVTPSFHEGVVLTGSFSTYDVHAFDSKSGKNKWSLRLSDDGPTAPTCKDGICVFNTYSCTMFGVDAETGKHLWSWYLGSPQLATPVIRGDLVYSSYPDYAGPAGATFVIGAFDLKTGAPKWRRWIDAEVNATPVAYGDSLYVATRVGTLYQFGALDGEVLEVRRNQIASPPVVTAGGLLFSRDVPPEPADMLKASQTIFPEIEGVALARKPVTIRPRPLVAKSRLISIDGGAIVARSKDSGQRLWQAPLHAYLPAPISDPLIYAGQSVLMATVTGSVVRFDAETGETMDAFDLAKAPLSSQPIAVDGWLYAGTVDGTLVAYDTGQPELTGWEMQGGTYDRQGTVDPEGP